MGAMAWAFVSLGNSLAFFRWGVLSLAVLAIVFAVAAPYGALSMAKAYTIATWSLTPACFYFALGKSPVSTLEAFVEITPLWIGVLVAVSAGTYVKSALDLRPVVDLVLESGVTLVVFFLVALLLTHRRHEYRRMASSLWALITEAGKQWRPATSK